MKEKEAQRKTLNESSENETLERCDVNRYRRVEKPQFQIELSTLSTFWALQTMLVDIELLQQIYHCWVARYDP